MEVISEITSEDLREKRESYIFKFQTEELFQNHINTIFNNSKFYSFNSIMLTSDNKIITLKRNSTFTLDMLFKFIVSTNKNRNIYTNFTNIIKNLSYNEQNYIKKIINKIEYNISEDKIKEDLYFELKDKSLVRKLYVVSKYIFKHYHVIFNIIYKTNSLYIKRKLNIRTKLCNIELLLEKNKDVLFYQEEKKI